MHNKKMLTLHMKVKVNEYNVHNVALRWQILFSVKIIWSLFPIALTVLETLTLQMDGKLRNVSEDQVKYIRSGVNRYEIPTFVNVISRMFAQAFAVSEILISKICYLEIILTWI